MRVRSGVSHGGNCSFSSSSSPPRINLQYAVDHVSGRSSSCFAPTWSASPSARQLCCPELHFSFDECPSQDAGSAKDFRPEEDFPHERFSARLSGNPGRPEPPGLPPKRSCQAPGTRRCQEGLGHWKWWSCHWPGWRVRLFRFVYHCALRGGDRLNESHDIKTCAWMLTTLTPNRLSSSQGSERGWCLVNSYQP